MPQSIQTLLSLPPAAAPHFTELTGRESPAWFAASDPPGSRLGSGGGTAYLLQEAWRRTGAGATFQAWLRTSRKLMIHGGGQSRRLPSYAPLGKLLAPMPVWRWAVGQHLDQTLLDLQLPGYRAVLEHAPAASVAMVASGDVLLRFSSRLPRFPEVDVLCLGLWVKPEEAQHFGVFFCPRQAPDTLGFFLQKPSPARIRELAGDHLFLVDTGMWLFSERALAVLLRKCGCSANPARRRPDTAQPYELYAEFGLGLGAQPAQADPEINRLRAAVVPLPEGEFYHFGTSRDLILSSSRLQNLVLDQRRVSTVNARPHPDMFTQNTTIESPLRHGTHTLWIENAHLAAGWKLSHGHVITGVPENDWQLDLDPGVCLDFVPVGGGKWCIRSFGIDDRFAGTLGNRGTLWFGKPVAAWLAARGLSLKDSGLEADGDIQQARLFPVLARAKMQARFVQWLVASTPEPDAAWRELWLRGPRLSAAELLVTADLGALETQRKACRARVLPVLAAHHQHSVFHKLDLRHTAALYAASSSPLPAPLPAAQGDVMKHVHDRMFRAAVQRQRRTRGWEKHEAEAFALLREAIVAGVAEKPVRPARRLLEDQIVWGRSPVRLDLAGGWTDTPPYCLLFGGKVVNVAVDLNGQPPIQIFAKASAKPEIVLRSIDLGVEERIRTFAEVADYARAGSAFGIAKAALALAGFLPRFCAGTPYPSLRRQLEDFGGGLELSLLAAVPKGSGLGTSSILAVTLLGTLGDLGGLNWTSQDLIVRTLALEQLLTTGGGWQDQVGGLLRSVKLIETRPGLTQEPAVKWIPDHLLSARYANSSVLLYYTGITRLAKGILQEIVRGMFLNSREHLEILGEMGHHAETTSAALQEADWDGLCQAVARSWELNQRLDAGTNPPAVREILDRVGQYLAGAKLLGAGGGGYMLMLAKDEHAAARIRRELESHRPNDRARFVDFSLSPTGMQITRS